MKISEEIKNWRGKPKELVTFLTKNIMEDKNLFSQLVNLLKTGSDVEKGTCADVMKHVTAENPEIAVPYIDDLIDFINYKAPRVKWGVPESIGNISKKHPEKVVKAIQKLLLNTKDDSTVVRWCAAYALTEIAKNNPITRVELVPILKEYVEKEKNNGVRNVYAKAIKVIEKGK
jgi:HEAT repeat protein